MHSIVYLAQSTKDQFAGTNEYEGFIKLVENSGYKVEILQATEDFYCRDYMPVQVSKNEFVQFVFNPKAYLKKSDF